MKTDTVDLAQARDVAIEVADGAASLIREHAGRLSDGQASAKGLNDFVTEVDREAQAYILQGLRDAFPRHSILAEEGEQPEKMNGGSGYRWIVDPIDGTTNFMHGVPPYAVSVALQYDSDVVVGVVLDVPNDELFTAIRGEGAFVNGRRIHVSRTSRLENALVATGFPYRRLAHMEEYLAVLERFLRRVRGVRRHGAASVDLVRVAQGRFDGFYETGLQPWDVAAGLLIVEEAGGRVTDYRDRPAPLFEKQMLATNGVVHEAMLQVLEGMREVRL